MNPRFNRRDVLKASAAGTGALAIAAHRPPGHAAAQDVVLPDDPRYPALLSGTNLRWAAQPAYVALCGDTDQVVQAVQRAVDDDLRITVRSGGHCYEDFVFGNDGGVIVDLSLMNAVWLDPDTGWYGVESGATMWSVYQQLYANFGVTLPGGTCATIGAGGHFTGGGYGPLSRLYGLTVDYLHAVEVVIVTSSGRAKAITVSRDATDPDEQDLIWGHLGGGGGNFGIVTKFWFRDPPPAPTDAYLLSFAWDWSTFDQPTFARLMSNYGGFLADNSTVDSPFNGLFTNLYVLHQAAGQFGLSAQYVGPEPDLLAEFAAVFGEGLPGTAPSIQQVPWIAAAEQMSGAGAPRRAKYKSAYMHANFPDAHIDAMWRHLAEPSNPNPSALLQFNSFGGQVNAVDPDATAVHQRSSVMKLQYQAYWDDPADDDANLTWIRAFYTEMYGDRGPIPDDVVDGCYVNYPDADLDDWQLLYYGDNYPRLQATKGRWDPLNIFNHRQSIELPNS